MADNKDKDEVVAYNQAVTNKPVVTDSVVTSDSNTNSTTTGTSHDRSTQSNYSTSKGETDRTTGLNLDQQVLDRYNQVIKNLGDDPRNSVAKAFLDTQPKPTPEQYEAQKAAAAKRAKLANLSESIRLLIDMGSGHAGGNVYKRDGVAQQVKEARKEADDADKAYADAVKEYNKNLYNANAEDAKFRRDLLTKFIETGRVEHGTTDNKQASSSNTATDRDSKQTTSGNTHSTQTTHHDYDDVYSTSEGGRYGTSSRGGGSGRTKPSANVIVPGYRQTTTYQVKTGADGKKQVVNQNTKVGRAKYQMTADEWNQLKPEVIRLGGNNKDVRANIARAFDIPEKDVQGLLNGNAKTMKNYNAEFRDAVILAIPQFCKEADEWMATKLEQGYNGAETPVKIDTNEQPANPERKTPVNNPTPQTGNGGYDYTKLFQ